MANLAELAGLRGNVGWDSLVEKIGAACLIKAHAITAEPTPLATKLAWAKNTFVDPRAAAYSVVWYVIAANAGVTTSQILGASDNAIQTNVNAAVDNLLSK